MRKYAKLPEKFFDQIPHIGFIEFSERPAEPSKHQGEAPTDEGRQDEPLDLSKATITSIHAVSSEEPDFIIDIPVDHDEAPNDTPVSDADSSASSDRKEGGEKPVEEEESKENVQPSSYQATGQLGGDSMQQ